MTTIVLSKTKANGYYVNQPAFGDMFDAGYTPAESIMEYAARTCYKSVGACGSVETFLKNKILQTGHHDVIEHGWLVLKCDLSELDILRLVEKNRYLVVDAGLGIIAGNMRSWYDLNNAGLVPWAKDALVEAAPKIFGGESVLKHNFADWYHEKELHPLSWKNGAMHSGKAVTTTVELLSWADGGPYQDMRHYTFAISGFSRSASLQLVRHRSCGFSQESQRYVDLGKGDWMPIVPPSIAGNAEAALAFEVYFDNTCRLYHRFRDEFGVKKEDARYVLDNSLETRIVMSGPQWAYDHFFKLRADDPAAQWEIRNIAKAMQSMMQATY